MALQIDKQIFPGFLGNAQTARGILLGCPWEESSSFRTGAVDAPVAIRRFAGAYEHRYGGEPTLSTDSLWDVGDVSLAGDNGTWHGLAKIESAAAEYWQNGRFLLSLGGSHGITYPLLKAACTRYPTLHYLAFDSHNGERNTDDGVTHSNYLYHCLENFIEREKVHVLGSRRLATALCCGASNVKSRPQLYCDTMALMTQLRNQPLYLSICLDVLEPAVAPATARPTFGGIDSEELFAVLYLMRKLNVVAMDIVGLVPNLDVSGATTALAAEIVRESCLYFQRGSSVTP